MKRACALSLAAVLAAALRVGAQVPAQREVIEVTATKVAEDVGKVPASVTVIDGDDIRARNARDLQSALALAGGLSIAPGGDAGPASSVPELWGLRELDAFLLVVDGVPWGGAFNPDLATVSLENVDRIEVVRGAAPVMYGATSFVGVIHVIHRDPGAAGSARLSLGNYGSGGAAVSLPLSQSPEWRQSLNADFEKRGFRDPGTKFDRSHLLYRAAGTAGGGTLSFDGDVTVLHQDPASPHPRQGGSLSSLVPLDANFNPRNGRIDDTRYHGVLGFDATAAGMPWRSTLAVTHSRGDLVRGFLSDLSGSAPDVAGFTQERSVTDVYFDTHAVRQLSQATRVIAGIDHLYGRGRADSGLFDYFVPLSGAARPASPEPDEETHLTDSRNFTGLYATAESQLTRRLRIDTGVRLNRTAESRTGSDEQSSERDSRSFTRLSGAVGANFELWSRNRDTLAVYADYRNTFKPAAIDFGPEAEGEILDPETAHSVEAGVKGHLLGGTLAWDVSAFQMDFANMVVSTIRNGFPAIENAGRERFRGAELTLDHRLSSSLRWELGYSYHDARFRDYEQNFDGTVMQLAGKRIEMSPFHLAGAGILWTPTDRLNLNVFANYVGERFLNKRNTAVADAYTTWSGGIGYHVGRGELRIDGRNLNDVRPPVSESELGDAQYYRMPARSWDVSYRVNF